ncbi:MAG: hypothetical protein Q4F65_00775 [Propionibacteriaceae bacterium]|nr:hypothetical protein [Propionibacteriaceae bacterium]
MDEHGVPTPRRALPARELPDDAAEGAGPDAAPRRGLWSATGAEDAPAEGASSPGSATPIPPPAVLPVSDVPPAAAGRRYSAEDLPDDDEDRPLPRRSALSPTASRARSPLSNDTPDPVEDAPKAPASRRRLVIGGIVALVVAAMVVAFFFLLTPERLARINTPPTPAIDPVATYLVQPEDLAGVRPDVTWETVTTVTSPDATTPAPKCLTPLSESVDPLDALVRTFSPTSGAAAGLLHQVVTYATPEEAAAAYTARVAQLGACERNTAWTQAGVTATDLADEATGATVVLQAAQPEYHTLVISRTGTRVNVVDATQADAPVAASSLLSALSATFARQCADTGTCPAPSAALADGTPPPAEPFGFLSGVDLPRITAGAGEWHGTPATTTVSTTGSRCEALDLTAQGSEPAQQRILLMQEDAAAPQGFGIDEIVYTFPTPEEAAGFVLALGGNLDSCAERTATAQVAKTADLTGPGTGAAWVVTQRTDEAEGTFRYRVAALAAGNRVVYLLVTSPNEFDFSDEAFHAVALRAAERLTQMP